MSDRLNQQIGFDKPDNQRNVQDGWCVRRYPNGMDTLGTRLKLAREAVGLTQGELAERVGMAGQSSIEAIEVGRSRRPTRIHEIAKVCGVTVEWLRGDTSEGGPKKKKEAAAISSAGEFYTPRDVIEKTVSLTLPEIDLRAAAGYGGGKSDEDWNEGGDSTDKSVASWGFPPEFVQRELGLQYGRAEVLQVRGDSMDDGSAKGLSSGDRVIIDRLDTDPRQGGIFAVFDGDGVIIKQVELLRGHEPPRIVCTSRNHSYRPVELILDGSVRVIGRVAGVISRR